MGERHAWNRGKNSREKQQINGKFLCEKRDKGRVGSKKVRPHHSGKVIPTLFSVGGEPNLKGATAVSESI